MCYQRILWRTSTYDSLNWIVTIQYSLLFAWLHIINRCNVAICTSTLSSTLSRYILSNVEIGLNTSSQEWIKHVYGVYNHVPILEHHDIHKFLSKKLLHNPCTPLFRTYNPSYKGRRLVIKCFLPKGWTHSISQKFRIPFMSPKCLPL